jgi:hypothetical protein
MKKIIFSLVLVLSSYAAWAQTFSLTGTLKDSVDNSPLIGANIILTSVRETDKKFYAVADINGNFQVTGLEKTFYKMEVSFVGYGTLKKFVRITDPVTTLGNVLMNEDAELLQEVTIEGETVASVQKGDTTQFNANAFKTNPDANTEDLIRKMPGITVENGTVQAQGENVGKVLVDGREFFGNDATVALRSLPADVVEKIEVFDRLSDQSQFTGFDDGNTTKTINIVTKSTLKTSQFGKIYAGYGTDNRYLAGGNLNIFNGDQRISFIGMSNNISEQNFSTQDLLGVVGTSNQRRGFGGGAGGGFTGGRAGFTGGNFRFGGTSNFLVGQQNGITSTNSFGINFMDSWGEKVNITASYFFNMTNNDNLQLVSQEYFLDDNNQFYDESTISRADNMNHRLNLRLEYTLNERNSLIWTPTVNLQDYESSSQVAGVNYLDETNLLSETENFNSANNYGYNIASNLLLRHSFAKRGRTLSWNIRTDYNEKDGDAFLTSSNNFYNGPVYSSDSLLQQTMTGSDGYTFASNLVYTEPLGESGQLQLSYNTSFARSNSTRYTYDFNYSDQLFSVLDTALSNTFMNDYLTQRAGGSYRLRKGKVFFTLGADFQNANLVGDQTFPVETSGEKTFNNILPNAMFMFTVSRNTNLRIFYRTRTNAPTISQLQNVVDNSNPLQLTTGNPDLKQQIDHFVIARYSLSRVESNSTFFALAFLRFADNYLGNSTIIADQNMVLPDGTVLNRGSQFSMPVNLSGYWSGRGFLTYGFPLRFVKSNLNLSSSYNYSRTPGLINNALNNSDSHTFSEGITLSSNISEKIDFTLSYSANYNIVENSIRPELDNNYFYHTAGFGSAITFWKGLVLRNDLNNYLYRGLSDEFNQDFFLWNISLAKRIFKEQNGEIRLGVFDVLKQNRSITRNVTETYVEDVNTEVLKQYFMLTFTYNLKALGQKKG